MLARQEQRFYSSKSSDLAYDLFKNDPGVGEDNGIEFQDDGTPAIGGMLLTPVISLAMLRGSFALRSHYRTQYFAAIRNYVTQKGMNFAPKAPTRVGQLFEDEFTPDLQHNMDILSNVRKIMETTEEGPERQAKIAEYLNKTGQRSGSVYGGYSQKIVGSALGKLIEEEQTIEDLDRADDLGLRQSVIVERFDTLIKSSQGKVITDWERDNRMTGPMRDQIRKVLSHLERNGYGKWSINQVKIHDKGQYAGLYALSFSDESGKLVQGADLVLPTYGGADEALRFTAKGGKFGPDAGRFRAQNFSDFLGVYNTTVSKDIFVNPFTGQQMVPQTFVEIGADKGGIGKVVRYTNAADAYLQGMDKPLQRWIKVLQSGKTPAQLKEKIAPINSLMLSPNMGNVKVADQVTAEHLETIAGSSVNVGFKRKMERLEKEGGARALEQLNQDVGKGKVGRRNSAIGDTIIQSNEYIRGLVEDNMVMSDPTTTVVMNVGGNEIRFPLGSVFADSRRQGGELNVNGALVLARTTKSGGPSSSKALNAGNVLQGVPMEETLNRGDYEAYRNLVGNPEAARYLLSEQHKLAGLETSGAIGAPGRQMVYSLLTEGVSMVERDQGLMVVDSLYGSRSLSPAQLKRLQNLSAKNFAVVGRFMMQNFYDRNFFMNSIQLKSNAHAHVATLGKQGVTVMGDFAVDSMQHGGDAQMSMVLEQKAKMAKEKGLPMLSLTEKELRAVGLSPSLAARNAKTKEYEVIYSYNETSNQLHFYTSKNAQSSLIHGKPTNKSITAMTTAEHVSHAMPESRPEYHAFQNALYTDAITSIYSTDMEKKQFYKEITIGSYYRAMDNILRSRAGETLISKKWQQDGVKIRGTNRIINDPQTLKLANKLYHEMVLGYDSDSWNGENYVTKIEITNNPREPIIFYNHGGVRTTEEQIRGRARSKDALRLRAEAPSLAKYKAEHPLLAWDQRVADLAQDYIKEMDTAYGTKAEEELRAKFGPQWSNHLFAAEADEAHVLEKVRRGDTNLSPFSYDRKMGKLNIHNMMVIAQSQANAPGAFTGNPKQRGYVDKKWGFQGSPKISMNEIEFIRKASPIYAGFLMDMMRVRNREVFLPNVIANALNRQLNETGKYNSDLTQVLYREGKTKGRSNFKELLDMTEQMTWYRKSLDPGGPVVKMTQKQIVDEAMTKLIGDIHTSDSELSKLMRVHAQMANLGQEKDSYYRQMDDYVSDLLGLKSGDNAAIYLEKNQALDFVNSFNGLQKAQVPAVGLTDKVVYLALPSEQRVNQIRPKDGGVAVQKVFAMPILDKRGDIRPVDEMNILAATDSPLQEAAMEKRRARFVTMAGAGKDTLEMARLQQMYNAFQRAKNTDAVQNSKPAVKEVMDSLEKHIGTRLRAIQQRIAENSAGKEGAGAATKIQPPKSVRARIIRSDDIATLLGSRQGMGSTNTLFMTEETFRNLAQGEMTHTRRALDNLKAGFGQAVTSEMVDQEEAFIQRMQDRRALRGTWQGKLMSTRLKEARKMGGIIPKNASTARELLSLSVRMAPHAQGSQGFNEVLKRMASQGQHKEATAIRGLIGEEAQTVSSLFGGGVDHKKPAWGVISAFETLEHLSYPGNQKIDKDPAAVFDRYRKVRELNRAWKDNTIRDQVRDLLEQNLRRRGLHSGQDVVNAALYAMDSKIAAMNAVFEMKNPGMGDVTIGHLLDQAIETGGHPADVIDKVDMVSRNFWELMSNTGKMSRKEAEKARRSVNSRSSFIKEGQNLMKIMNAYFEVRTAKSETTHEQIGKLRDRANRMLRNVGNISFSANAERNQEIKKHVTGKLQGFLDALDGAGDEIKSARDIRMLAEKGILTGWGLAYPNLTEAHSGHYSVQLVTRQLIQKMKGGSQSAINAALQTLSNYGNVMFTDAVTASKMDRDFDGDEKAFFASLIDKVYDKETKQNSAVENITNQMHEGILFHENGRYKPLNFRTAVTLDAFTNGEHARSEIGLMSARDWLSTKAKDIAKGLHAAGYAHDLDDVMRRVEDNMIKMVKGRQNYTHSERESILDNLFIFHEAAMKDKKDSKGKTIISVARPNGDVSYTREILPDELKLTTLIKDTGRQLGIDFSKDYAELDLVRKKNKDLKDNVSALKNASTSAESIIRHDANEIEEMVRFLQQGPTQTRSAQLTKTLTGQLDKYRVYTQVVGRALLSSDTESGAAKTRMGRLLEHMTFNFGYMVNQIPAIQAKKGFLDIQGAIEKMFNEFQNVYSGENLADPRANHGRIDQMATDFMNGEIGFRASRATRREIEMSNFLKVRSGSNGPNQTITMKAFQEYYHAKSLITADLMERMVKNGTNTLEDGRSAASLLDVDSTVKKLMNTVFKGRQDYSHAEVANMVEKMASISYRDAMKVSKRVDRSNFKATLSGGMLSALEAVRQDSAKTSEAIVDGMQKFNASSAGAGAIRSVFHSMHEMYGMAKRNGVIASMKDLLGFMKANKAGEPLQESFDRLMSREMDRFGSTKGLSTSPVFHYMKDLMGPDVMELFIAINRDRSGEKLFGVKGRPKVGSVLGPKALPILGVTAAVMGGLAMMAPTPTRGASRESATQNVRSEYDDARAQNMLDTHNNVARVAVVSPWVKEMVNETRKEQAYFKGSWYASTSILGR